MNFNYFLFIFSSLFLLVSSKISYEFVTCGSSLKLINTLHSVRLHSHEVKYGSGSGQQSVTAVDKSDDHNSYWQIRDRHPNNNLNKEKCSRGEPIACGQVIRLTHLSTQKNLHTHHFSSPLSSNMEVSAFGDNGVGDEGDDWTVICDGQYWKRTDKNVKFRHVNTELYLTVSGERYGRPISGQAEVCSTHRPISGSDWGTAEGVFIKPNSEPMPGQGNSATDHDDEDEDSARKYHTDGDL